jgi:hypothetical protein
MAVRRWILVIVPRLIAKDSSNLLALAQPEVRGLDIDAGGAEVCGAAELLPAAGGS